MNDCLFCKIIAGEIASTKVYEDDDILAFNDINPGAPFHFLIIPKKHISTLNDAQPSEQALLGKMMTTAADLAKKHRFAEAGYRITMNCNQQGGQIIYHLHLHCLGGRQMRAVG